MKIPGWPVKDFIIALSWGMGYQRPHMESHYQVSGLLLGHQIFIDLSGGVEVEIRESPCPRGGAGLSVLSMSCRVLLLLSMAYAPCWCSVNASFICGWSGCL